MRIRLLSLLVLLLSLAWVRADENVTISKERLQELERKAAEADRLQRELDARNAELERLKNSKPANPTPKAEPWLPTAAVKAAEKAPPTPPLASVAPLLPDQVVSVHDVLNHYAADCTAADARYKRQMMTVKGIITGLDKAILVSTYSAGFRIPGAEERLECEFTPERGFNTVYLTTDKERIVGETDRLRRTFATVGTEVIIRGRCTGLKGKVVGMNGCSWVTSK